jgi:hypothetical protein
MSTNPLFSRVAVWLSRAVARLPVDTNPGTSSRVEPLIDPTAAWIVDCPAETAVARPDVFIVATPGAELDHVAVDVRFWVLRSEYVPVAVNC